MKTRNVDRFRAKDYLKRAEECKKAMERSFEAKDWNASVINAIHCAISASDAVCIFKKGLRSASDNHNDAVALFASVGIDDAEIKRAASHLSRLLSIKTDAEYGERLASEKNAEESRKHAERLFGFAKGKIP